MTYTTGIPAANNNPSDDQSPMQANTNAIATWTAVDHVGITTPSNTGEHLQVNFPAEVTQGSQTDPASVLYTASGATSSHANLFYKNVDGTFPISCIRAFGFVSSAGALQANAYNITSASGSAGSYTVVLTANAVASADTKAVTVQVSALDNGPVFANYFTTYASGILTVNVGTWDASNSGARKAQPFSITVIQM